MNRVLILASGGMDSSVLMALYKRLGYEVKLMFFNYGQAGYQQEYDALIHQMVKLNMSKDDLVQIKIDMPWSQGSMLNSNLKGQVTGDSQAMYVEMRNLIFASYALSFCESESISTLALGFIDSEGIQYADSSETFVLDLNDLANRAIGVRVVAPLANLNKKLVAWLGKDLGLDVMSTFSCNTPISGEPCGICGDCKTRESIKEALKS